MGGGSSVMVSDLELYDRDPANPDDDPEELKQLDSDLRKGIYIHCSRAVTELRLPFNGRYLIYVRGAKGMGRDKDPHQQAGGGWDTFDGGGGACLEAEFDLTNQHTLSFLVGSAGSQQGCGGGGSFVAYRLVEQQGWDVKHHRPRFAKFVVPGEDVREVGKPFLMRVKVPWGSSRAAVFVVPVPLHLKPGSTCRYPLPKGISFLREWHPLMVAGGGGGGAGQCSAGQDALLAEFGGDGCGAETSRICTGGRDGMAGQSQLDETGFAAHGGAGYFGNGQKFNGKQGAHAFVFGGHGAFGGGFGGGGGGNFAGGGGGGYSGGGAGALSSGRNAWGGGGGGSFAHVKAKTLTMSTGHRESGLVFLQLLPDWRDANCPVKDRIASVRDEASLKKRVREDFVRRLTARVGLPGQCHFSAERGWEHTMTQLEALEAESTKQKDRKIRYDDWNGAAAHERFERLNLVDKYVGEAQQKMSSFGIEDTQVIARQELAAEKAEKDLQAILASFDEQRHPPHQGSRARDALESRGGRLQSAIARRLALGGADASGVLLGGANTEAQARSLRAWEKGWAKIRGAFGVSHAIKNAEGFMLDESDVAAQREMVKAIALGDVPQMETLLAHGLGVNTKLTNKGSALHVAVRSDALGSLRLLLDAGGDISAVDGDGMHPIQAAVIGHNFKMYATLADRHTVEDLQSMRDPDGNSLLHQATTAGLSPEIVADLIDRRQVSSMLRNNKGLTARDIILKKTTDEITGETVHKQIKQLTLDAYSKASKAIRSQNLTIDRRPPLSAIRHAEGMWHPLTVLNGEDDFRLTTDWLQAHGVSDPAQHAKILLKSGIGYDKLLTLTDAKLVKMGVSKIGIRLRIMQGISRAEEEHQKAKGEEKRLAVEVNRVKRDIALGRVPTSEDRQLLLQRASSFERVGSRS